MKLKIVLLIGVLILMAACCYFFTSTPSTRAKTQPFNAQYVEPLIAPRVPGSSRIENTGTPAATQSPIVPMSFTVAELTLPLVFADTGANPELQQVVARDLQLIYGHLAGHEVVSSVGTFPPLMVNGQTVAAIKLLNFIGKGRHTPSQITREIGYVGNIDGLEALLISDKVIAAYSEAVERRAAQPEAFREIDRFVEKLNLLEASKPIEDANQLFVIDPAVAREFDEIGPNSFGQQFAGRKYRAPSILEIVDGGRISERYKGRLVGKLYNLTQDGIEDSIPPIIFDEGRWKFLIVSPQA